MKNQPYPTDLNDAKKNGVVFFEAGSTPADKADLFSNINNGSQVGIGTTQTVKQQLLIQELAHLRSLLPLLWMD
ncbi:hypothetical protein KF7HA_00307 [Lactococcus lactis]|nr:hypothetical protein [Lactococcus lactis]